MLRPYVLSEPIAYCLLPIAFFSSPYSSTAL